jgi:hypothetical protein
MHVVLTIHKVGERKNYLYMKVAQWDKILNIVELRMFHDMRYLGVNLTPRYPISKTNYLHFANPYKKIKIEIIYKNTPDDVVKRKIAFLETYGWKIFTTKSQHTYHIIDEFFCLKEK